MVLLPNCTINIARSSFTKATNVTNAATPLRNGILVHLKPNVQNAFKLLPEAAVESDYVINADTGEDIRVEDIVTDIFLLDGVTPWPGLDIGQNDNEQWVVNFVRLSTPGPLAERQCYIKRMTGGGRIFV